MMGRSTLLFLLLTTIVTVSSAQRQRQEPDPTGLVADLGSGATLVVHVVLTNNQPVGQDYAIVLESVHEGAVGRYVTNRQGEVTFRGIRAGEYIVHVSGSNIKDTASGTIDLSRYDHRSEFVKVELANPDGTSAITSKQGSVSAATLNIPDKARKERDKGNEALARGDGDKAKGHYLKAIELYPKYASAYNNLGTIYIMAKDTAHAREAWSKALEIDPNLDSANINMAKLDFQDKDYAGAIAPLERVLITQPKNPDLLLLMSEAQLLTRNYDKALLYAHKIFEGDHQQYQIGRIVAGRALEMQNRPEQARTEYEVLLKEAPNDPQAVEAKKSLARLDSVAKK